MCCARAGLEFAAERAYACGTCVCRSTSCRHAGTEQVGTAEGAVQSASASRRGCGTVQQGIPVTSGWAWMVSTKALQPANAAGP